MTRRRSGARRREESAGTGVRSTVLGAGPTGAGRLDLASGTDCCGTGGTARHWRAEQTVDDHKGPGPGTGSGDRPSGSAGLGFRSRCRFRPRRTCSPMRSAIRPMSGRRGPTARGRGLTDRPPAPSCSSSRGGDLQDRHRVARPRVPSCRVAHPEVAGPGLPAAARRLSTRCRRRVGPVTEASLYVNDFNVAALALRADRFHHGGDFRHSPRSYRLVISSMVNLCGVNCRTTLTWIRESRIAWPRTAGFRP